MFLRNLLCMLVLGAFVYAMQGAKLRMRDLCSQQQCVQNNCSICYCSDKCGPRKKGEKESDRENPTIWDANLGICFCQKQDQDNYYLNGCDKQ